MLDPFCGCATTLVAAESLGREWAGIDLSPLAVTLVDQRLRDSHGVFGQIIARADVPARTDVEELPDYRTHKHTLYGVQEGRCTGCRTHFQFRTTAPSTTWCHGPRADRTTRRTPATLRGV